jgi:hypothetical protein
MKTRPPVNVVRDQRTSRKMIAGIRAAENLEGHTAHEPHDHTAPRDRRFALTKQRSVAIAAIVLYVVAQAIVWGRGVLVMAPLIVAAAIGMFWVIYVIRDRHLQASRAPDSTFTTSASLYVDGAETIPEIAHSLGRLGLFSRLGGGAATGLMDFTEEGLRWRPGPVSRRQGFREFRIPRDRIATASVHPNIPGLGRLAAQLELRIISGSSVQFWVRDAARVASALEALGKLLERPT